MDIDPDGHFSHCRFKYYMGLMIGHLRNNWWLLVDYLRKHYRWTKRWFMTKRNCWNRHKRKNIYIEKYQNEWIKFNLKYIIIWPQMSEYLFYRTLIHLYIFTFTSYDLTMKFLSSIYPMFKVPNLGVLIYTCSSSNLLT